MITPSKEGASRAKKGKFEKDFYKNYGRDKSGEEGIFSGSAERNELKKREGGEA